MTYDLGLEIYASAWVGITGTFILMAKWLREKMGSLYGDFVDSVDRKNGDLGLDRSVDTSAIVWDYLLPIGGGAIDAYTGRNNYPQDQYVTEISVEVGWPVALVGFIIIFVLAFLSVFAGPLVYLIWGIAYAAEYLVILITLVGANLVAYLLL